MRIGLIRTRYTPYGGAEVFLSRFIDGLLQRGHGVEVFASDWIEQKGVRFHKVEASGPSFLRPLIFARNARKAVEAARPDIVVSLERTYCQDIYRAGDGCHREWLIRRGQAVGPLKRFLIRLNPLHFTLLHLEKKLFSSPGLKCVVANSKRVKGEIIRHYGLPEEKIYVIYNGIGGASVDSIGAAERHALRSGLGLNEGSVLLLFVGSGFERKGLIYLIRALGLLKDRGDIRLLVVGKGDTSKYSKEARRLGVGERVVFKGPVKDAIKLYPAGDIFVLPSIYEPFSNACLEAMASGLPVVTSRVNGASEVITEGREGAIVEDPADETELAGKISLFLDKDKRIKAGAQARKRAGDFRIEDTVSSFLRIIEGC
ncbi:MAG: glycosyltransferase family 4 protein [Deltaproteobacteria bacterium]|nr:glycosyltransferase family 4 protein [Deltaproteobacteria bacterium]